MIMSTQPMKAVISDLGKAVVAKHHYIHYLGLTHTCAPEVFDDEYFYDEKVDVYSFAYLLAWILGYRPPTSRSAGSDTTRFGYS